MTREVLSDIALAAIVLMGAARYRGLVRIPNEMTGW